MENQELIKQVTEKAEKWLTPAYDAETQAEVKRMLENDDKTELIEAFYKDLEFGTGGLRGIMGVGSNRMNIYTVGAATQGLSNYLKKNFKDLPQISVVVGHDCRNNSRLFAETSANIFSANGIKVYLFDDMRPTPEMSFAIRHLGCQSGIILTAYDREFTKGPERADYCGIMVRQPVSFNVLLSGKGRFFRHGPLDAQAIGGRDRTRMCHRRIYGQT